MRLIFDIEGDGLLPTLSQVHCICIADYDTGKTWSFTPDNLNSAYDVLNNAEVLAGHNIIGYDLPALKKIFGWEFNCMLHDTLLMSQSMNFKRFPNGRHRLEDWGESLGFPKIEFNNFSQFSEEMLKYCENDVQLNVKVYHQLLQEFKKIVSVNPFFRQALRNEHDVARFCQRAEERGWLFDKDSCENLMIDMEAEMAGTEAVINPLLPIKIVATDKCKGVVEPKNPRWLKNGNYDIHTARWFGIDQTTGMDEDRLVEGPYSRVEFIHPDMSNMDSVKEFLYSIGWEPDDWNRKKDENGNWVNTTPKLSESSLLALGEFGEIINAYTTTKSRHGILKGWLENLDSQSRLHGVNFTIGTPTGRGRHSVIVNVPGAEEPWGKQIRSLFRADRGKKIIGADSSGNQFRALCHYLKNEEYTELVLTGDVHQKNADILTAILQEMGVYGEGEVVARKTAKPFIYAFLFGAGGEKLALIVLGKRNKKIGNKLKNEFIKRVPGLAELTEKLEKIYWKTSQYGNPYIPGIDGRRIYCDSSHKSLNYLLQAFEAISCKAAVAWIMRRLDEEKIPWDPLVWYHDEFEIEVDEGYAEVVKEMSIEAYRESGKVFGMMILDGAAKIGDSWYDVH